MRLDAILRDYLDSADAESYDLGCAGNGASQGGAGAVLAQRLENLRTRSRVLLAMLLGLHTLLLVLVIASLWTPDAESFALRNTMFGVSAGGLLVWMVGLVRYQERVEFALSMVELLHEEDPQSFRRVVSHLLTHGFYPARRGWLQILTGGSA